MKTNHELVRELNRALELTNAVMFGHGGDNYKAMLEHRARIIDCIEEASKGQQLVMGPGEAFIEEHDKPVCVPAKDVVDEFRAFTIASYGQDLGVNAAREFIEWLGKNFLMIRKGAGA